jgi:hypothetical protein
VQLTESFVGFVVNYRDVTSNYRECTSATTESENRLFSTKIPIPMKIAKIINAIFSLIEWFLIDVQLVHSVQCRSLVHAGESMLSVACFQMQKI